jgi:sugar fermentation stimulation protein A
MQFVPNLQMGRLIQRYKRFLVDIQLEDGSIITAHCANTGPMTGLIQPGKKVAFTQSSGKNRKLGYTLEMVWVDDTWVGANTQVPNRLIRQAFDRGKLAILSDYPVLHSEVSVGDSRLDFYATKHGGGTKPKKRSHHNEAEQPEKSETETGLYIEVKCAHLRRGNQAFFPDTVTTRGARHLRTLIQPAQQGYGAMMIYVIQRNDCNIFSIAADLDPDYARAFQDAVAAGVRCMAYTCDVSPEGISLGEIVPIQESF